MSRKGLTASSIFYRVSILGGVAIFLFLLAIVVISLSINANNQAKLEQVRQELIFLQQELADYQASHEGNFPAVNTNHSLLLAKAMGKKVAEQLMCKYSGRLESFQYSFCNRRVGELPGQETAPCYQIDVTLKAGQPRAVAFVVTSDTLLEVWR